MGYHSGCGRKMTNEFIAEQAKKYETRTQFLTNDSSCYQIARNRGIIDDICQHMISSNYSTPQLICKYIFDILFRNKFESCFHISDLKSIFIFV